MREFLHITALCLSSLLVVMSIAGFIYFIREDPIEFMWTVIGYVGLLGIGLFTLSMTLIWG